MTDNKHLIPDEEAADWMLREDDSKDYSNFDKKNAMSDKEFEQFVEKLKEDVASR